MNKKNEKNFEDSLSRLEEIADLLENENTPLEDSIKLFEEGIELKDLCEEKLKSAKLKIDKIKLNNVLKTTTFEYLQNLEKKDNFKEATTVSKKINFFKYGPKNDGKKGIPKEIIENLEKNLGKEMKELGYL